MLKVLVEGFCHIGIAELAGPNITVQYEMLLDAKLDPEHEEAIDIVVEVRLFNIKPSSNIKMYLIVIL